MRLTSRLHGEMVPGSRGFQEKGTGLWEVKLADVHGWIPSIKGTEQFAGPLAEGAAHTSTEGCAWGKLAEERLHPRCLLPPGELSQAPGALGGQCQEPVQAKSSPCPPAGVLAGGQTRAASPGAGSWDWPRSSGGHWPTVWREQPGRAPMQPRGRGDRQGGGQHWSAAGRGPSGVWPRSLPTSPARPFPSPGPAPTRLCSQVRGGSLPSRHLGKGRGGMGGGG